MYDNDNQPSAPRAAGCTESAVAVRRAQTSDLPHTGAGYTCTTFGLNPRHFDLAVGHNLLTIRVNREAELEGNGYVVDSLRHVLERTPRGWGWALDVDAVTAIDLPFMDCILVAGIGLRQAGGTLTLTGFRIPANLALFSQMFEARCKEHHITWVRCNDGAR